MYNITSVYPVPALHFPQNTELVDRKIYCIILVKKCGGTEYDYNKVDHLTIGEFGPILIVSWRNRAVQNTMNIGAEFF